MNMMTPVNQPDVPAYDVQQRVLRAAKQMGSAMGLDGYFSVNANVYPDGRKEAFITHWFRPEPNAFLDCRAACASDSTSLGTMEHALYELDRYVQERTSQHAREAA